jgi:hypothetical protein
MTKADIVIDVIGTTYEGMLDLFTSIISEDEFILSRYSDFDIIITCSRTGSDDQD